MDPSSRRDKQAEDKNNVMMKWQVEFIRYKTEPFSFFIHWLKLQWRHLFLNSDTKIQCWEATNGMNVASCCFQGQDWMLNIKFGWEVISEMEILICVIWSKSSRPAEDEPFGPDSDINTFTFSSARTVFCFLVIHSIVNVVHTPFNLVCLTISRWHISADCLIKTVTVIFSSSIWWTNAQNPSTHTQNNNGAGLWVGQMPSTPSYQRSDENRLKKKTVAWQHNITAKAAMGRLKVLWREWDVERGRGEGRRML